MIDVDGISGTLYTFSMIKLESEFHFDFSGQRSLTLSWSASAIPLRILKDFLSPLIVLLMRDLWTPMVRAIWAPLTSFIIILTLIFLLKVVSMSSSFSKLYVTTPTFVKEFCKYADR